MVSLEYKWKLLIITTIGTFMMSLDGSILNIAIPSLSQDLKASFEIVQWIPIIYLLIMAISLITFGRLADLKGKRRFFILGLFCFTIGSLLSSIAWTGEQLIIYRAIQAVGASLIGATGIAMVTETFPKQETGKALGITVAGIYLGLVLGPVLGGVLVYWLTWRSIFYINIPIGGILIALSYSKLKESKIVAKEETFDIFGTIFFGLFLATLLIALTLGNRLGWTSSSIIMLIIISFIAFIIFIFTENRVKYPMLNLNLFRHNRVFAAANSAALLNYIATMGVGFLLSIYLQSFLGYSALVAGLLLLPTSAIMAGASPFTGAFSDKVGTRILCALGMSIMAIGIGGLIFILSNPAIPIEWILLSQGIVGLGIGFFSSPNQSAIMKSVEKKQLGIASGTLSTMRVTGQSISIALLSSILSLFVLPNILNQILAHQYSGDLSAIQGQFEMGLISAFSVTIIICLCGAVLSLVRGKETQYQQI
ncbi:MAG: MFS transporter [Candidatus Helarchaeota archaeon]